MSWWIRSTFRMGVRRIGVTAAIAALAGATPVLAEVTVGKLPLSAPVKVLPPQPAPQQPAGQTVVPLQERPQPTLPSGKLPQYQLPGEHRVGASIEELNNPKLQFQLALPSRTILIEADITIEGRPFRMVRETRIEEIIKAATAPAAPEGSEAPAEPAEAPAKTIAAEAEEVEGAAPPEASPPSTPPYSPAGTAEEFVRRYFAATGRELTPEEVRWLLAERIDGPVLLFLNDNFQRFRANQRPVFHVLDRDRDSILSADELQRSVDGFQECDLNRDGIIDYSEITQAADDPRLKSSRPPARGKLIQHVSNAAAPDISLTVSFDRSDPTAARIAVTAVSGDLHRDAVDAAVNGEIIMLRLKDAILAFSAVQDPDGDQISLGAVNDGYPLLPELDPNDDGRFTVRELRELEPRLRQFDRNQDGGLTADETPSTFRICVGLGPNVHRELAGIRSVHPPSVAPAVQAPAWFVRMDRNKDHDLTRAEFPGTDEQFLALDADKDGLVSEQEAADFESRLQAPE